MEYYLKEDPKERTLAYFSLEIGLSPKIPTYSGGLGILAGDTIKSFADAGLPCVAVTLLYEKGFFHQNIDEKGNQQEVAVEWDKSKYMRLLPNKINVKLEGRDIILQAWVYEVKGVNGNIVPVIFLDANIDMNSEEDKNLTYYLYGGDRRYRLLQEALLGIGGVRMLQSLGHDEIEIYHMNEGHAALLTLELMNKHQNEIEEVRELCVFTTHTPVPAGHDSFDIGLAKSILRDFYNIDELNHHNMIDQEGKLNMTYLAMHHSKHVNGVAKKHSEVSKKMFPGYSIDAITNGVHVPTWVCESMGQIFDKHIGCWKSDHYSLRYALSIPDDVIWDAHMQAKQNLIDYIKKQKNIELDKNLLTIGFARRAATYKRADLIFKNIKKLIEINDKSGQIQIIFAGKAHPNDEGGKNIIREIYKDIKELEGKIKVVYLENYEMFLGKLLTSGVDVWLNNPMRPREASGTSGMKAALNGIPHFSVLDGWWLEGHVEDLTGWSIGPRPKDIEEEVDETKDLEDLYYKLEKKIIPKFYNNKKEWREMMKHCIAFNGSFFNTQRMVSQYLMNSYFK